MMRDLGPGSVVWVIPNVNYMAAHEVVLEDEIEDRDEPGWWRCRLQEYPAVTVEGKESLMFPTFREAQQHIVRCYDREAKLLEQKLTEVKERLEKNRRMLEVN